MEFQNDSESPCTVFSMKSGSSKQFLYSVFFLMKLALKTNKSINLFLISFNWAMRCHIHLLWAPKGIKLVKNGVLSLVLNISPLLASLLAC
jgi:hypothetical protein